MAYGRPQPNSLWGQTAGEAGTTCEWAMTRSLTISAPPRLGGFRDLSEAIAIAWRSRAMRSMSLAIGLSAPQLRGR